MDLSTAQLHLDAWLAADLALSQNQSYAIGELSLTRANAQHVRDQILYWQRVVDAYTATAAGSTSSSVSFASFV